MRLTRLDHISVQDLYVPSISAVWSSRFENFWENASELLEVRNLMIASWFWWRFRIWLNQMHRLPPICLATTCVECAIICVSSASIGSDHTNTSRLTDEIALASINYPCLSHSLRKHIRIRLAKQPLSRIVTIGDPLKQVLNSQQLHYFLPVRNIGVRKKPRLDLGRINILNELPQIRTWLDDVLQR